MMQTRRALTNDAVLARDRGSGLSSGNRRNGGGGGDCGDYDYDDGGAGTVRRGEG